MGNPRKRTLLHCKECGKEMQVRNDYVKCHSGICMSCQKKGNSCARKHGAYKTRLYHIWVGLSHRRYKSYDPEVCEEWKKSFPAFEKWAHENGYSDNLTIDRIDNKKGYSPDNCQWIEPAENAAKDKRLFTREQKEKIFRDRKQSGLTQIEMAKLLGVSRNTIQRLEREVKNGCA